MGPAATDDEDVRSARAMGTVALANIAAFIVVVVVLTIVQWTHLYAVGWSPVHRTPVEWPSLLATGAGGWALDAVFCLSGLSLVGLAITVAGAETYRYRRFAATAVTVMGVGMCLIAFQTDLPGVESASWHATIHNRVFPLIPLGGIAATIAFSIEPIRSELRSAARILLPGLLITFGATNIDSVAQLARYFAFASLIALTGLLAVACIRGRFSSSTGHETHD